MLALVTTSQGCSPKSLLRHRLVKSDADDFGPGTKFQRYLEDTEITAAPEKVRKLVMCTGKVYYDLIAEREKRGIDDVAIARCEQIAPFPFDRVKADAEKYPNAELVWCQEEPKNAGAWQYVRPRIITAAKEGGREGVAPAFAGRAPSASTSTFASQSSRSSASIQRLNASRSTSTVRQWKLDTETSSSAPSRAVRTLRTRR